MFPPRSPPLVFAADESSLERILGHYLEERGLKVLWRGDEDDVWLVTNWEGGGAVPGFAVIIDTMRTSVVDVVPRERGVILRLQTRFTVPADETPAVLGRLNAHHATNWAGT